MDDDLHALSREQPITEAPRLCGGVRRHRDSSGHELCWHHPELWGLLPEQSELPEELEFTDGIVEAIHSAGEELRHYFPGAHDDVNELTNDINIDA
jgi:hypothetical protein